MARRERQKGARGEREVRDILRRYGFHAERDGRLATDLFHNVPGAHLEVKRVERLNLPAALRQAEEDAVTFGRPGDVPVVVHRRSHEPWRATLPLDEFLRLKRMEVEHGVSED